ncbi:hypothetical protein AQJ46_50755 [Streptomyces canus]|uniref:Uncharacterized protein n=1 Tax=Streptomyces canus TaxID=58343 RepID=A0A101RJS9_9ACTN|nr:MULTISPECIES: hypothetical protein [Streptomyces]KUN52665.1 hypothetical protein AQJ46_50755 [Streptomyces canus]MDI5906426.1 hypothetical protein [Streptomyces sp. 12257]
MFEDLPDLGSPVASVPGAAFEAFGGGGLVVLVPDDLVLERQADGSAALLVTLLRSPSAPGGAGGRIEIGFTVDLSFDAVGQALIAQKVPARLVPGELEGGVLEITAQLGTDSATALVPPVVLSPAMLARAHVVVDLSAQSAVLAARLIRESALPVRAVLRLRFPAVAPRVPLELEFDRRRVAQLLAERFGAQAVVSDTMLGQGLDALLADPAVTVTGDPSVIGSDLRAEILGLRLRDELAVSETGAAVRYRLRPAEEISPEPRRVDLATVERVSADRLLTVDPFATARVLSDGGLERYVRTVDVPALPTGRVRVSFAANLPEPMAGLLALFADLRVPALPPFRSQEVMAGVELSAPERRAEAEIVLSPGEALTGQVRLRALLESADTPVEVTGPWRPAAGDRLVLGPESFPLPLTVVRASGAFTDAATGDVRSTAGRLVARLDAGSPLVAVPRESADPPATVVVRPIGPGRTIDLPFGTAPRLDLDPVALPGFGAHRALAVSRVVPGRPPLLVEWRPQSGEHEPMAVRLGTDRPEAEIGWIAASPFQPGFLWRVTRGSDAPGPWSEPVMPADGLVVQVDAGLPEEPVVLDGLELRPDPADPSVWTYVPPGPFLEFGPDGRPALGLVDAGAVCFLQITSRFDLPNAAREALPARLLPLTGRPPAAVRAVEVTVTRVAVEVRPPDGTWAPVAESTSSGISPWTTALSATLSADQTAAVKAAVDGTRGRMRLVGELAAGGKNFVNEQDVADLLGKS